jgi:hypothetical protein
MESALQVVFPSGATGTLGAIVGTVVNSRRWSSTHVSGSGGGGPVMVGGYVAPTVVSSRVIEHHEFWLQTKDNIPSQRFDLDIPVTNGHQVCLISANIMGKHRLVYWADYTSGDQGIVNRSDRDILFGYKGTLEVLCYVLIIAAIIFGVCCLLSFHMVSQLGADSYSSASSAEILNLVLAFGILFSFLPILIAFKAFKIGRKRTTKIMAKNAPVVIKLCEPLAIQISEAMWPTPHSWEPLRQSSQARPDPRFPAPIVSVAAPASKGASLSIPAPIRRAISVLLYAVAALLGLVVLVILARCIQIQHFGPMVFAVPPAALAFGLFMAGNYFRRKKATAVMVAPPRAN